MKGTGIRTPFLLSLGAALVACASPRDRSLSPMPEVIVSSEAHVAPRRPRSSGQDGELGDMRVPSHDGPLRAWPASGLWVGAAGVAGGFTEDLADDGGSQLFGPTDVITIPQLDEGAGYLGYLGYRWKRYELIVSYEQSEFDGSFPGSPLNNDSKFKSLDVNFRRYFWLRSPLQPFLLLGMGWSELSIDNGATDTNPTVTPPAVVQEGELEDGINVNVGAGLAFYPIPWVMAYGQAMYRFTRFTASDGIDGKLVNDGDIDGDGWQIQIGAAIRLLPGRK